VSAVGRGSARGDRLSESDCESGVSSESRRVGSGLGRGIFFVQILGDGFEGAGGGDGLGEPEIFGLVRLPSAVEADASVWSAIAVLRTRGRESCKSLWIPEVIRDVGSVILLRVKSSPVT